MNESFAISAYLYYSTNITLRQSKQKLKISNGKTPGKKLLRDPNSKLHWQTFRETRR